MSERILSDNSCIIIPFYSDPTLPSYAESVSKFADFLENAKDITGLTLAVVDDGCKLTNKQLKDTPDFLVSLPVNQGKAYAMRVGLKALLAAPNIKADFIIQYDGDGDQSFKDIPSVHSKLLELTENDPSIAALVIGDRYSEDLKIPPNPESVVYRQSLLMFFGAIANQLGFENVRDWVSGARSYTREYAKGFLENSRSSRYGLESEQLVIASLINAKVTTASLTESRPRDPDTLTSKWLQNFEVYDDHEIALRSQGKGHVVNLIQDLVQNLKTEKDTFALKLTSLDEETEILFSRRGDRYTAEIPGEYRSRLFAEDSFPFAIRKPSNLIGATS